MQDIAGGTARICATVVLKEKIEDFLLFLQRDVSTNRVQSRMRFFEPDYAKFFNTLVAEVRGGFPSDSDGHKKQPRIPRR